MEQPSSTPATPNPPRDRRLSLDELSAVALGADPARMTFAQLYLGLDGRIARRTFWLHGVLALLIAGVVIDALLDIASVTNETTGKLVNLLFLWPLIAVSAKRQHDFNFSGWWALIHLVPGVGSLVLLVVDGIAPGPHGPNRFGPDPRTFLNNAH
jgi:uncharacterized membrane protein YhaH (DUF805 family)